MISINLSELIWTVINFFLLLFLLNRFLYQPIIRFTEERQRKMDEKLAQEQSAKAEISENEERISAEKLRCREEAKEILTNLAGTMEQKHAEVVQQARTASGENLKKADEELADRREKTAEALQNATPELAELLTRQLLEQQ